MRSARHPAVVPTPAVTTPSSRAPDHPVHSPATGAGRVLWHAARRRPTPQGHGDGEHGLGEVERQGGGERGCGGAHHAHTDQLGRAVVLGAAGVTQGEGAAEPGRHHGERAGTRGRCPGWGRRARAVAEPRPPRRATAAVRVRSRRRMVRASQARMMTRPRAARAGVEVGRGRPRGLRGVPG